MRFQEKKITYFEEPGEINTEKTIELAVKYAKENKINTIVIGSATGKSALMLKDKARDLKIINVVYSAALPYKDAIKTFEKNKNRLEEQGIIIVRCTHAFSGIDKCVFKKYSSATPHILISDTLKLISEGTKVAVECALMAADVGAIKQKEQVLAIGGTSEGVDTCLLVEPSTTSNFFDFGILEIICIPRYGGLFHG